MGRITSQGGLVVVDFRGCGAHEPFELYQALGLMCAHQEVRCALLKTGTEEADVHHTLLDVLATVACIAGIPLPFRLALVATREPIARVFRSVQRNVDPLGCEARVFCDESEAERWLRSGEQLAQRDPAMTAPLGAMPGTASQGAAFPP